MHDHASDGADAIAEALGRTKSSVQSQAKRYGLSLRRFYVCPKCQKATTKWLSPVTGWCPTCCIEVSTEKAAEKNRQIQDEIRREETRIESAKRKRQAIYSDNTRKKRRLRELRQLDDNPEREET